MSARAGTQSASRARARSHAHLEHAEHLPAHPDGHARGRRRRRRRAGPPTPPPRPRGCGGRGRRRAGRAAARRAAPDEVPARDGAGGSPSATQSRASVQSRPCTSASSTAGAASASDSEAVRAWVARWRAAARRSPRAPVAQVADVRGEDDAPLDVGRHHDDLDRHERAVGAHGGRLAAAAEVGALAGQDEVAQAAPQLVAQGGGHDACRRPRGRGSRSGCSRRAVAPRR